MDDAGKYVMFYDPLDGSSNIDANVPIGTIYGICRRVTPEGGKIAKEDYLRSGNEFIAAGYCLYGSATMMCLAVKGEGV